MARAHRWAYMGLPGHNPPNNDCPECTEPSKTFFVGGRTVDGKTTYSYRCEHHHEWVTSEKGNSNAGG